MRLSLDQQYIHRVSSRLLKFSTKSSTLYNFRCNICHDSKKDSTAKRGYFYVNKNKTGYSFVCHNCGGLNGSSCSFSAWLKDFDLSIYEQYVMDSISQTDRDFVIDKKPKTDNIEDESYLDIVTKPIFNKKEPTHDNSDLYLEADPELYDPELISQVELETISRVELGSDPDLELELAGKNPFAGRSQSRLSSPTIEIPDLTPDLGDFKRIQRPKLEDLRKISDLDPTHGARKYVENRKIPESQFDKLFFVWKFFAWCNSWKPESFSREMVEHFEEPRLIIPFYDKDGQLMMIQGRSFAKDAKIRYFSIKCDDDFPKIFGLEQIDYSKIVQVWEGPVDSFFGDNAVAMAGADAHPSLYFNDYVLIYDNEPRNAEICKRMQRAITKGEKVVIWPKSIPEKYDGNDMILKLGLTKPQLNEIIRKNTFYGIEANLAFGEWKRMDITKKPTRRKDAFSDLKFEI